LNLSRAFTTALRSGNPGVKLVERCYTKTVQKVVLNHLMSSKPVLKHHQQVMKGQVRSGREAKQREIGLAVGPLYAGSYRTKK
jgi:hypothetical protein